MIWSYKKLQQNGKTSLPTTTTDAVANAKVFQTSKTRFYHPSKPAVPCQLFYKL